MKKPTSLPDRKTKIEPYLTLTLNFSKQNRRKLQNLNLEIKAGVVIRLSKTSLLCLKRLKRFKRFKHFKHFPGNEHQNLNLNNCLRN